MENGQVPRSAVLSLSPLSLSLARKLGIETRILISSVLSSINDQFFLYRSLQIRNEIRLASAIQRDPFLHL